MSRCFPGRAPRSDEANLNAANLHAANLSCASLTGANLRGANLSDADLGGAVLQRVDLSGANVSNSNLENAVLLLTTFGNNDLTAVRGLETARHFGPSTIGIDTILRSKGRIPESFLRRAGIPDSFITYMKSLVGSQGFEFYSCFISYSTKDQEFADRLYADLQNKGVRCWFAPHDMRSGEKVHEQIDEAIRLHDRLLLILSKHSMASEWDWECFDAHTGKDSACEIREYFIPDFSGWKNHDSFQRAFQRLLHDLKAHDLAVRNERT